MLFAAGLGTRLRPLTNDRPKALVEVNGKSLLSWNLEKLLGPEGFQSVIVNVHYFADQIMAHVEARKDLQSKVIFSDERAALLETGGGLLLARPHLGDDDFLVHNVDILSDLPLRDGIMAAHKSRSALATLATRQRKTSRYLLFGTEDDLLCGWENVGTGERKMARDRPYAQLTRRAFSGISTYSPGIFEYMQLPVGSKFSIIDTLLFAARTEKIYCYPYNEGQWMDVGRPEDVETAANSFNFKL